MNTLNVSKGSRVNATGTWAGGPYTGDTIDVLDGDMVAHEFVTVAWVSDAAGTFALTISENLHTATDPDKRIVRLRKTSASGPVAFEAFRILLV